MPEPPAALIVDIHPHVVSHDHAAYPLAPLFGRQSAWSRERPADVDQLLEPMDAAGVAKAVVVQTSTGYGFDNSYLAEAVATHPGRLVGVGSVDIRDPAVAGRLEAWVRGSRLVGMRVFTTGSTMPTQADWLNSPDTHGFWRWTADEEVPVCVQLKVEGYPMLRDVLTRFPTRPQLLDLRCLEVDPVHEAFDAMAGEQATTSARWRSPPSSRPGPTTDRCGSCPP